MTGDDIVPEDFELSKARSAHTTTSEDERKRCPECGSVRLLPRSGSSRGPDAPGDYRCEKCGATPLEIDVDGGKA